MKKTQIPRVPTPEQPPQLSVDQLDAVLEWMQRLPQTIVAYMPRLVIAAMFVLLFYGSG
jgi:ATP/maltotriose-dependent transcriptional regulator MalT